VPAAGEHVDFQLNPSANLDADASTSDDTGPNAGADGECTIVFSSSTTGLATEPQGSLLTNE
jgi:hypothetical protein